MFVAGIHLQHVVHGGNAADEVAFLHLGDPGNHQLFPWSCFGSEFPRLLAGGADLFRITAVERDPSPSDSQCRIFFYCCAPVFVAALQIEILVILHAFEEELASFR